jgi:frataxin-like iron-binding protein CyaY
MFTSTDYENKVLTMMIFNSTDIEINKQPTLILTEF